MVRNEFEMGENSAGGVLFQRMQRLAYAWHNYGNAIIGARSDIEAVPIDRLQAFYRTWYQPDNALLIVGGRFDAARALALVERHFAPIPKPARALPALYTAEPMQDGERSVTLRRVGDTPLVAAMYRVPCRRAPGLSGGGCARRGAARRARRAGCTRRWCKRDSPARAGPASAPCAIRA